MTSINFSRIPLLMALAVFSLSVVRLLYFYSSPDETLIAAIPDDAFYYIQLAKHRVTDGFWTFDGVSPATGFHLLYGYMLALIYYIFGDIQWRVLYLAVGILGSLSVATSALLICQVTKNLFNNYTAIVAGAFFLTTASLEQSAFLVESWMVLFFASLAIYCSASTAVELNKVGVIILLLVGIFGSLSRSDFGMLPAMLFLSFIAFNKLNASQDVKKTAIMLVGAVSGVTLSMAHNYMLSGEFAQASARTKIHWSSLNGHDITVPLRLVAKAVFGHDSKGYINVTQALLIVAIIFACRSLYQTFKSRRDRKEIKKASLFAASIFTITGYLFFYRHNSASLQPWYLANLISPIAISVAIGCNYIFLTKLKYVAPLILVSLLYLWLPSLFNARWPHQAGMMKAGIYIKNFEDANYGAWNAGIISYFAEKNVVNLDGLTNDDVYQYITSNKLSEYLRKRNISYIVDYDAMLKREYYRVRGGYNEEGVIDCIRKLRRIDDGEKNWSGTSLNLYQFSSACI